MRDIPEEVLISYVNEAPPHPSEPSAEREPVTFSLTFLVVREGIYAE